jgi:hypothetical protein
MFKDLTPKADMTKVQTINLRDLSFVGRVSERALKEIEANERQAARCLTDTTLFR